MTFRPTCRTPELDATAMKILYTAYPLLPVTEAAAGGSEQVLYWLLRGLQERAAAAGESSFRATTLARQGSTVAGDIAALVSGDARLETLQREQCRRILALTRRESWSLVHNQGADPRPWAEAIAPIPVLFTVHLARSLYPADFFDHLPGNVRLQCVSRTQHEQYERDPGLQDRLMGVVENGIPVEQFIAGAGDGGYLLYLGRVCEEKGAHLAIEFARRCGRRLVLAGCVYPLPYHQNYFATRIAPALGAAVMWREAPTLAEKRELLANAAAVVIPSLVDETSSLVAMEAAASATPVLALRRGALPEIVEEGRTGWLGADLDELWEGWKRLGQIDRTECRRVAERRFNYRRMVEGYWKLYTELAAAERVRNGARLRR